MHFEVIEVTPQLAEKWLKSKAKNRILSIPYIKEIAKAISEGRWVLNGETIIFDAGGKLIDGQHRLSAVVMSGVTIPMSIAYGVDDSRAFETIDVTIRPRRVSQVLQMEGHKNTKSMDSIARRLLAWDITPDRNRFTTHGESSRMTRLDILDAARTYQDEILYILQEMANTLPHVRCGAGASFLTALILCNRVDDVATLLFMEGLKTGANLSSNSPVFHLRERLIMPPKRFDRKQWETEVMALTIKAFNKFRKNETVKVLSWRQAGDVPEKFPIPGDSR